MIYRVIDEDNLQVVHTTTDETEANTVAKQMTIDFERKFVVWSGV